jgi:hypothetical protein
MVVKPLAPGATEDLVVVALITQLDLVPVVKVMPAVAGQYQVMIAIEQPAVAVALEEARHQPILLRRGITDLVQVH